MADGFLGRWSRRKQDVRDGKPVAEPAPPVLEPAAPSITADARGMSTGVTPPAAVPGHPVTTPRSDAPPAEAPPPPTLADAAALTTESDFKPFVQRAVSPEVRNLAMKKLFADPHFNVMDGLDIYVGDYTQPDPLPEGMLRQMASAHAMGFFDHEKQLAKGEGEGEGGDGDGDVKPPASAQPRDDAEQEMPASVAQSRVCTAVPSGAASEPGATAPSPSGTAPAPASQPDHDHDAHLRLQPDDAPRRESVGRGTA